ncbi:MAG: PKD domain-containing protein [Candidatus Omnitrophica bacterium]|nr:PKD domain-containing protein [Candidatus Omnitrophota bacterium]
MKKFYPIFILAIFLSGCATYRIQQEKDGFAVSRYKKVIPEYTQGTDNSFPDKEIAEERFKRRKKTVEYYYKKMGFISNRFKQVFVEPPVVFVQFVTGIFRMPFIAVSDYKYNHNPQYKEKMDKLEDEQYEAEKARIKGLKEELSAYIKEDLVKEPSLQDGQEGKLEKKGKVKEAPVAALEETKIEKPVEVPVVAPELVLKEEVKPKETKPSPVVLPSPQAVIIAKPQNGPSPLKVNFCGTKSKSPNGRIISYEWDFGDGDKSNKPNPTNTYWSTTYGIREFTATLTITDNKGMSSSASTTIQVVNK